MDLETRKISFVQEFFRLQNEEIILEQYNAEINQAMDSSKNGRMIKATDLRTKIKK